jgi:hypothetical protein
VIENTSLAKSQEPGYEPEGRRFDSFRARHFFSHFLNQLRRNFCFNSFLNSWRSWNNCGFFSREVEAISYAFSPSVLNTAGKNGAYDSGTIAKTEGALSFRTGARTAGARFVPSRGLRCG